MEYKKHIKSFFKYLFLSLFFIIILFTLIAIIVNKIKTPSNDRIWNKDQKILSYANFDENNKNLIHIYNIRNITYRNETDFDVYYYNRTVNIENLETLDYMVEDLEGFPGFAHTLLTFGFKDGTHTAISVEIRKEVGEHYHPVTGVLAKFELMYVIADERDVINLRANYRNDTIYLYPINISKQSLDNLFVNMLIKTNKLTTKPLFYNTFTSTCTTNLAEEASISTNQSFLRYHPYILLPGYSDKILLNRNLIITNITNREELKIKFNINKQAREYEYSDDFSKGIRIYS